MHKLDNDEIANIAINAVDKMVEVCLIQDCTDTDGTDEFEAQDIIRAAIIKNLAEYHPHLINLDDGDIQDFLQS